MTGTGGDAVTDTYSYDAHDKLTGISGGTNKTYGYDSNGNCTSVTVGTNVITVAYDVENRVTQITYPSSATNTFAYNGNDLRTQKVDSSGTKNYVCDGSSPASAVLKDGAAVYTPGLSERRGSASKFLHADALGSTRGITDSTQAVTDSMLYDAFGNVLSRTGTTPTPFGFAGGSQYQTDGDSGLQLLGHRYYDPSIGRFLSRDSAKAGTNWYAYCDNNPLKKVDPQGKIAIVLGGVVVAIAVVDVAIVVGVVIVGAGIISEIRHPGSFRETVNDGIDWVKGKLGRIKEGIDNIFEGPAGPPQETAQVPKPTEGQIQQATQAMRREGWGPVDNRPVWSPDAPEPPAGGNPPWSDPIGPEAPPSSPTPEGPSQPNLPGSGDWGGPNDGPSFPGSDSW